MAGKKFKAALATLPDYEPQTGENSPVELASQIDALEVMGVAPSRMSICGPKLVAEKIDPGTASTSRLNSTFAAAACAAASGRKFKQPAVTVSNVRRMVRLVMRR